MCHDKERNVRRVTQTDEAPSPAAALVTPVTAALEEFLDSHTSLLREIHPDLALLADAARASVLDGGKRLRPAFAYWGWRTTQPVDAPGESALLRAAASLELLHACALVHDDVMDASDTRRGKPASHRAFANVHSTEQWPGSADTFGAAAAILLGDLLLSWAEEMFTAAISELPADRALAAEAQFDLMRTEVVAGQFLDVLAQTRGQFDVAEALRVVQFKTSKYTVERPLLLGASAAGAPDDVSRALSAYGLAIGEAFQLRDDLLGVFGDPAETGKPAGDDLREGKRTLLVALAHEAGSAAQRIAIEQGVGNEALTDEDVEELRDLLVATGARDEIEARIQTRATDATAALTETEAIGSQARSALLALAHAAAHRTR
jgi:geranylgeranyl diphosphate synthase type I